MDGEEAEASDDQMNYPSLRKKRERLGHPAPAMVAIKLWLLVSMTETVPQDDGEQACGRE